MYYFIGTSTTQYNYNSTYTITAGNINLECLTLLLKDGLNPTTCFANIIVCPPKPCSEDCDLESYVRGVNCEEEEEEEVFYAYLSLSGGGSDQYCYESYAVSDPGNTGNENHFSGSFSNPLGPFKEEDVYVILYLCNTSECTCDPTCFKIFYIPKPDCNNLEYRSNIKKKTDLNHSADVWLMVNPISKNEIILRSLMKETSFILTNVNGKMIYQGTFQGSEYRFTPEILAGLYFITYFSADGQLNYIKFIKY